jgi:predicted RNA binding protein with dsRBD fold (UPF0201 family)
VKKCRERLEVDKQISQRFHMERFKLKKLNEVEGKEKITLSSTKFTALEHFDDDFEIKRVRETIRENIRISAKEGSGYFELKKHMLWFDEGCQNY